jgi:hypothetical protein
LAYSGEFPFFPYFGKFKNVTVWLSIFIIICIFNIICSSSRVVGVGQVTMNGKLESVRAGPMERAVEEVRRGPFGRDPAEPEYVPDLVVLN